MSFKRVATSPYTRGWKDLQARLIEGEKPREPLFYQYPEDCVDNKLAASSSSAHTTSKLRRSRDVIYIERTFEGQA